jgi:hypothetical protein
VGGEVAASSFEAPWMIWVILALGRNTGVAGAVAGERWFEGVKRGDGCCGGDKRACTADIEPTLAVRVWGNGKG